MSAGLTTHRLALAGALLCTGPALIVHDGWAAAVPAAAAAGYAGYLLAGKRRWRAVRGPAGMRRRRPLRGSVPRQVVPAPAEPRQPSATQD